MAEHKEEKNGFSELIKYTIFGYIAGIAAGIALDKFGFQKSGLGQAFVRTLSGEGESIFEGFYAIKKRLSKATFSMAEAYGWGKFLGMFFPWVIDFASRMAGINVYGVEGFYIPYFYALSDQIGANVSGAIFIYRKTGNFPQAAWEYFKSPVMISSLLIIVLVPFGLFLARTLGFSPATQTLSALETIAANLCWLPPLIGHFKGDKEHKTCCDHDPTIQTPAIAGNSSMAPKAPCSGGGVTKIKVLFLCASNSCRSQMAEGILKALSPEKFEVFSAGAKASFTHPFAVKVLEETGIDISGQRSKSLLEFKDREFDYVITVCGNSAKESCPSFMGKAGNRLHWNFEDPAEAKGTEEEVLKVFRKVRDEIKTEIEKFIKINPPVSPFSKGG